MHWRNVRFDFDPEQGTVIVPTNVVAAVVNDIAYDIVVLRRAVRIANRTLNTAARETGDGLHLWQPPAGRVQISANPVELPTCDACTWVPPRPVYHRVTWSPRVLGGTGWYVESSGPILAMQHAGVLVRPDLANATSRRRGGVVLYALTQRCPRDMHLWSTLSHGIVSEFQLSPIPGYDQTQWDYACRSFASVPSAAPLPTAPRVITIPAQYIYDSTQLSVNGGFRYWSGTTLNAAARHSGLLPMNDSASDTELWLHQLFGLQTFVASRRGVKADDTSTRQEQFILSSQATLPACASRDTAAGIVVEVDRMYPRDAAACRSSRNFPTTFAAGTVERAVVSLLTSGLLTSDAAEAEDGRLPFGPMRVRVSYSASPPSLAGAFSVPPNCHQESAAPMYVAPASMLNAADMPCIIPLNARDFATRPLPRRKLPLCGGACLPALFPEGARTPFNFAVRFSVFPDCSSTNGTAKGTLIYEYSTTNVAAAICHAGFGSDTTMSSANPDSPRLDVYVIWRGYRASFPFSVRNGVASAPYGAGYGVIFSRSPTPPSTLDDRWDVLGPIPRRFVNYTSSDLLPCVGAGIFPVARTPVNVAAFVSQVTEAVHPNPDSTDPSALPVFVHLVPPRRLYFAISFGLVRCTAMLDPSVAAGGKSDEFGYYVSLSRQPNLDVNRTDRTRVTVGRWQGRLVRDAGVVGTTLYHEGSDLLGVALHEGLFDVATIEDDAVALDVHLEMGMRAAFASFRYGVLSRAVAEPRSTFAVTRAGVPRPSHLVAHPPSVPVVLVGNEQHWLFTPIRGMPGALSSDSCVATGAILHGLLDPLSPKTVTVWVHPYELVREDEGTGISVVPGTRMFNVESRSFVVDGPLLLLSLSPRAEDALPPGLLLGRNQVPLVLPSPLRAAQVPWAATVVGATIYDAAVSDVVLAAVHASALTVDYGTSSSSWDDMVVDTDDDEARVVEGSGGGGPANLTSLAPRSPLTAVVVTLCRDCGNSVVGLPRRGVFSVGSDVVRDSFSFNETALATFRDARSVSETVNLSWWSPLLFSPRVAGGAAVYPLMTPLPVAVLSEDSSLLPPRARRRSVTSEALPRVPSWDFIVPADDVDEELDGGENGSVSVAVDIFFPGALPHMTAATDLWWSSGFSSCAQRSYILKSKGEQTVFDSLTRVFGDVTDAPSATDDEPANRRWPSVSRVDRQVTSMSDSRVTRLLTFVKRRFSISPLIDSPLQCANAVAGGAQVFSLDSELHCAAMFSGRQPSTFATPATTARLRDQRTDFVGLPLLLVTAVYLDVTVACDDEPSSHDNPPALPYYAPGLTNNSISARGFGGQMTLAVYAFDATRILVAPPNSSRTDSQGRFVSTPDISIRFDTEAVQAHFASTSLMTWSPAYSPCGAALHWITSTTDLRYGAVHSGVLPPLLSKFSPAATRRLPFWLNATIRSFVRPTARPPLRSPVGYHWFPASVHNGLSTQQCRVDVAAGKERAAWMELAVWGITMTPPPPNPVEGAATLSLIRGGTDGLVRYNETQNPTATSAPAASSRSLCIHVSAVAAQVNGLASGIPELTDITHAIHIASMMTSLFDQRRQRSPLSYEVCWACHVSTSRSGSVAPPTWTSMILPGASHRYHWPDLEDDRSGFDYQPAAAIHVSIAEAERAIAKLAKATEDDFWREGSFKLKQLVIPNVALPVVVSPNGLRSARGCDVFVAMSDIAAALVVRAIVGFPRPCWLWVARTDASTGGGVNREVIEGEDGARGSSRCQENGTPLCCPLRETFDLHIFKSSEYSSDKPIYPTCEHWGVAASMEPDRTFSRSTGIDFRVTRPSGRTAEPNSVASTTAFGLGVFDDAPPPPFPPGCSVTVITRVFASVWPRLVGGILAMNAQFATASISAAALGHRLLAFDTAAAALVKEDSGHPFGLLGTNVSVYRGCSSSGGDVVINPPFSAAGFPFYDSLTVSLASAIHVFGRHEDADDSSATNTAETATGTFPSFGRTFANVTMGAAVQRNFFSLVVTGTYPAHEARLTGAGHYTSDSPLHDASFHASQVAPGETKRIYVYTFSVWAPFAWQSTHGVTSRPGSASSPAYLVLRKPLTAAQWGCIEIEEAFVPGPASRFQVRRSATLVTVVSPSVVWTLPRGERIVGSQLLSKAMGLNATGEVPARLYQLAGTDVSVASVHRGILDEFSGPWLVRLALWNLSAISMARDDVSAIDYVGTSAGGVVSRSVTAIPSQSAEMGLAMSDALACFEPRVSMTRSGSRSRTPSTSRPSSTLSASRPTESPSPPTLSSTLTITKSVTPPPTPSETRAATLSNTASVRSPSLTQSATRQSASPSAPSMSISNSLNVSVSGSVSLFPLDLLTMPPDGPLDLMSAAGRAIDAYQDGITSVMAANDVMLSELEAAGAAALTRNVLARADFLWTRIVELSVNLSGIAIAPHGNVFAVSDAAAADAVTAGCLLDPHRIALATMNGTIITTLFDAAAPTVRISAGKRQKPLWSRLNFTFVVEPPGILLDDHVPQEMATVYRSTPAYDRRFARISMRRWHAGALRAAWNRSVLPPEAARLEVWLNVTRGCFAHDTSSRTVHVTTLLTHENVTEPAQSQTAVVAAAVKRTSEMAAVALSSLAPSMAVVAAKLQSLKVHCDVASFDEPPEFIGNLLGTSLRFPWEPSMQANIEEQDDAALFKALLAATAETLLGTANTSSRATTAADASTNSNASTAASKAITTLSARRVRASPAALAQRAASLFINPVLFLIPPFTALVFASLLAIGINRAFPGRKELFYRAQQCQVGSAAFGCLLVVIAPALEAAVVLLHFSDHRATMGLVIAAVVFWLLLLFVPVVVVLWPPHFDAVFVHAFENPGDETFFVGGYISWNTLRLRVMSGEWKSRRDGAGRGISAAADKLHDEAKGEADAVVVERRRWRFVDLTSWVQNANFTDFFAALFNGYRAPYHAFMIFQLVVTLVAVAGSAVSRSVVPWRCLVGSSVQFGVMFIQFVVIVKTHPERYRIERGIGTMSAVSELFLVAVQLGNVLGAGWSVFDEAFHVGFIVLGALLTLYEVYEFSRKYLSRAFKQGRVFISVDDDDDAKKDKEIRLLGDGASAKGLDAPLLQVPAPDASSLSSATANVLPGSPPSPAPPAASLPSGVTVDGRRLAALLVRSGDGPSATCTRFASVEEFRRWKGNRGDVPPRLLQLLSNRGGGANDRLPVSPTSRSSFSGRRPTLRVLRPTGDPQRDASLPRPTCPSVVPAEWMTLESEMDYWEEYLLQSVVSPPPFAADATGVPTVLVTRALSNPTLSASFRHGDGQVTQLPASATVDTLIHPAGGGRGNPLPARPIPTALVAPSRRPALNSSRRPSLDRVPRSLRLPSQEREGRPRPSKARPGSDSSFDDSDIIEEGDMTEQRDHRVSDDLMGDAEAEALLVRNWQQHTLRTAGIRGTTMYQILHGEEAQSAVPADVASQFAGDPFAALQSLFSHEDDEDVDSAFGPLVHDNADVL